MDGTGFVLFLFFFGLGLLITFLLIKASIDNSRTSEEITEIRRLLQILVTDKKAGIREEADADTEEEVVAEAEAEELKEFEIMDIPYEKCPACGADISQDDGKCPSCDIALK
ncbi:hypothetical protein CLHUN_33070 [Ruminiclostridium hungatei]|uniref:Uncharacterized protein n=1 Tax=Ruminiclostridium hungatei TaxID=48256 RepID=A0A1V4SGG2_RUMHU|nr:hypothetical protein [Ruminiclostridium hungatei]OPX42823.1 hypothetical protein CLHUN_33070 [Ruminiclostridium hungatei]